MRSVELWDRFRVSVWISFVFFDEPLIVGFLESYGHILGERHTFVGELLPDRLGNDAVVKVGAKLGAGTKQEVRCDSGNGDRSVLS